MYMKKNIFKILLLSASVIMVSWIVSSCNNPQKKQKWSLRNLSKT